MKKGKDSRPPRGALDILRRRIWILTPTLWFPSDPYGYFDLFHKLFQQCQPTWVTLVEPGGIARNIRNLTEFRYYLRLF
jgi:hypothetical protein